jgi:hypothetical protein
MNEAQSSELSPKQRDFLRNPTYDRRVVAFFDILGWRSEIEDAGADPERIGRLRRIVLQYSRMLRLPVLAPVNVTTFSDNVVISTPPDKINTPFFLREMAVIQAMTVSLGFLPRGGITIGDILHDDETVFGPGLNRAYELESRIANFPRIVVDEAVLKIGEISGFDCFEDGVHFLDPFTPTFMELWFERASDREEAQEQYVQAGLLASNRSLKGIPGYIALKVILEKLKPRIRSPLGDKEWEKVAWLYDRIAKQLGDPHARSYPRVRPSNSMVGSERAEIAR